MSPARGGDNGRDERRGAWPAAEAPPPPPFSFSSLLLLPSPFSSPPPPFSPLLPCSSPPLRRFRGGGQPGQGTTDGAGVGGSRGRAPQAGPRPVAERGRGEAGCGGGRAAVGQGRGGAAHHRPGRADPGAGRPRRRFGGAGGPRRRGGAGARGCERESGSGPAGPLGVSGVALCRVPRYGHSAKKFREGFF